MKIYYFSGATLPSDSAQSVHVMKMCAALAGAAKSNAVTLFAKCAGNAENEEIFQYYGVDPVFSLILSRDVKIPGVSGVARLAGHNWALRGMGDPDLAYGRDPAELQLLVPDSVPVVLEAHQLPTSFLQQWAVASLLQRKNFRGLVVISEALRKDCLIKFRRLKSDRVMVAPDGADIPVRTAAEKALPGRDGVLKIGYTGSLHEGKGMEALAVLAQALPEFDFHVVGGAWEQVESWKRRGLPSNLFMHGHATHKEIPQWLAAFDVVVAPYREEARIRSGRDIARWISPLKIFEYMAAKKPMVCSDLPVIREVLQDRENVLLVLPDDVKGWVEALRRLNEDKGLRERLGARAYEDLERRYTWKNRARNILKFVDKGD